ncbi:MAG: DUF559 domain-containing protein [Solirubrobacteraceae bacterium]
MTPIPHEEWAVRHGWPYREVAAIAADQRLLIAHSQLRELGIPARTIHNAVTRRQLHPFRNRGIYAMVEPRALPPLAVEQAAILACGPHAALSHLSALSLWGLLNTQYPGSVELTVAGVATGRRRAGLRVHRAAAFEAGERRRHQRLPVTSPALALLDSVPLLSGRAIELSLDTALNRHLTSRSAVLESIARHPYRSGVDVLRTLLDPRRPTSMTESPGQERLLELLRRTDLPRPETEQWIGRYRVDLLWRELRVVVEFDGWRWHGAHERFESDRVRENWLRNHDWRIVRVTYRELDEKPEQVLVWIATEIANARNALRRG